MNNPLVSVIIPTYNSERSLTRSLESIKNQTYKNIEVIIIDNHSKDKTVEIAKKFGSKVIVGYYNKPEARNIGVELSKGRYVFHADCDFILERGLIKEAVEILEKEGCDAIFIPERYEGDGFWRNCRNLEKKIYEGNEIIEAPRIYKKSIFEKFTFDEKNEGFDEYDFYFTVKNNLGLKTCRIRSLVKLAELTLNPHKRFNQGKYYDYYKIKHIGETTPSAQMSLTYRIGIFKKCSNYSRIYTLGLIILKSISYFSFLAGKLTGKFDRKVQRLFIRPQDIFDHVAKTYDTDMFSGSLGNRFVNYKEKETALRIVNELFKNKKIKVLDVGAGNGRWSAEFAKMGFDITALDISSGMCSNLKQNFKNLRVIEKDIANVTIDEKFDLIFSFRSFKYVENKKRALEKIKKILKRGGYLFVEMPNLSNPFYFFPYILSPFIYPLYKNKFIRSFIIAEYTTKNSFENELKGFGFKLIKTENLFFFPHYLYSKINNKKILDLVYYFDSLLFKIFPRSIIYVVKK